MSTRRSRACRSTLVALLGLFLSALGVAAACSAGDSSGPEGAVGDPGDERFYVVVFEDYPELDPIAELPFDQRGRTLVDELRATADRSQQEARELLDDEGAEYRTLWLSNAIAVCTCDQDLADRLEGLDGVAEIVGGRDAIVEAADDEPVFPGTAPTSSPALDALGVTALRSAPGAPTGDGVTVGVVDTGVDATHPALAAGYRGAAGAQGGPVEHERNWFDPYGVCDQPCDPQGHGTHVASIAVGRAVTPTTPAAPGGAPWAGGSTAVPAVGVAPGASWMAARGCTGAVCDLDELLAALQFMVAPTDRDGGNPDADLRPDVLVNSWGLRSPNLALERAQRAIETSGIIPVAAAGNNGPECGTVTTPG